MSIRSRLLAAGAIAALIVPWHAALAQAVPDHAATHASGHAELADGEVRKIDKESGKITLRHGPIKHLDMPPMSMVFTARDKTLLDKVKVGDKVRFMEENDNGKMVVTDIQPAK